MNCEAHWKKIFIEEKGLEDRKYTSLKYWGAGHKKFFSRVCEEIGEEFSENMLVVFEQFKVVYI